MRRYYRTGMQTYMFILNNCQNALLRDISILNSNKGFGINVQDGATVSDVVFSSLTIETSRRHWNWWGSSEMCKFVLKKRSASSRLGAIRNIVVDNVIAHVRGTSTMTGHPERPLQNISMAGVQVFMNPENAKDKRATDGMRLEGVQGLRIRDLSVDWTENETETKWQSALVLKNVSDFELDSFTGRQGLKASDVPAIVLDQSGDGTIHDSRAAAGCSTFVHVQGAASRNIVLRNNDARKAEKTITFENDTVRNAVEL
jgi:hypothetical protein